MFNDHGLSLKKKYKTDLEAGYLSQYLVWFLFFSPVIFDPVIGV